MAHVFQFNLENPLLKGTLFVKGSIKKLFKRRFFVLYPSFLVYYEDILKWKSDAWKGNTLGGRSGAVYLKHATCDGSIVESKAHSFGIFLRCPDIRNKRKYLEMGVLDAEEQKTWIAAIRQAIPQPTDRLECHTEALVDSAEAVSRESTPEESASRDTEMSGNRSRPDESASRDTEMSGNRSTPDESASRDTEMSGNRSTPDESASRDTEMSGTPASRDTEISGNRSTQDEIVSREISSSSISDFDSSISRFESCNVVSAEEAVNDSSGTIQQTVSWNEPIVEFRIIIVNTATPHYLDEISVTDRASKSSSIFEESSDLQCIEC